MIDSAMLSLYEKFKFGQIVLSCMADLSHLFPICRAIAAVLPGQVEVVLHDLQSNSIAMIESGFSPHRVGDDSFIAPQDYLTDLNSDDTIGPFRKTHASGVQLRSVSALIRDENGAPHGLLCLNLRTDELQAARNILDSLCRLETEEPSQMSLHDWREITNAIIAASLKEMKLAFNEIRKEERQEIVSRLMDADVFAARGSADYVAEALGISRTSLYALIKAVKSIRATLT